MCADQSQAGTPTGKKANKPHTTKKAPLADELASGAVLVHSIGTPTDYEIFVTELCMKPAAGELGAFANNLHLALLSRAWITGKKSAIFSFVLHEPRVVNNIVICNSDAAADDPRLKDTQLTLEIVGTMLKRARGSVASYLVEPAPADEAAPIRVSQVTADTMIAELARFYGLG